MLCSFVIQLYKCRIPLQTRLRPMERSYTKVFPWLTVLGLETLCFSIGIKFSPVVVMESEY
jgi:hypothetical protein